MAEGHRQRLLHVWPELPQKLFGGKSARAAAQDGSQRVRVLGAILILDLSNDNQLSAADYNQFRRELGLPELGLIDPSQTTMLALAEARLAQLDVAKLTDQDLVIAYQRAQETHFLRAIEVLGRAIVARPSLDTQIDKAAVYAMLAQMETDPAQAGVDLDEARRIAEAAGRSTARFDLIELAVRMGLGDLADADRVLRISR